MQNMHGGSSGGKRGCVRSQGSARTLAAAREQRDHCSLLFSSGPEPDANFAEHCHGPAAEDDQLILLPVNWTFSS